MALNGVNMECLPCFTDLVLITCIYPIQLVSNRKELGLWECNWTEFESHIHTVILYLYYYLKFAEIILTAFAVSDVRKRRSVQSICW